MIVTNMKWRRVLEFVRRRFREEVFVKFSKTMNNEKKNCKCIDILIFFRKIFEINFIYLLTVKYKIYFEYEILSDLHLFMIILIFRT